jgi:NAD(P)-dependent dehydrogenase (short-subunit alcohol dehydrogenase family)
MRLEVRAVTITDGRRGIGRAIFMALAREGADIIIVS